MKNLPATAKHLRLRIIQEYFGLFSFHFSSSAQQRFSATKTSASETS
jgi:hypothetical protein